MEDSEEELLKELDRRSRDLESLATQLSGSSRSDAADANLLVIGGLTASASDVLGMERGEECSLTIHLSGIDSRRIGFRTKELRSQACRRLLRLCGATSLASPFSPSYVPDTEAGEGEAWIELGRLLVRKDCVVGCEKRSALPARRRSHDAGSHRVVVDSREESQKLWLTVHLSGMDAWHRDFEKAETQESAWRLVCGCVWGEGWQGRLERFGQVR